MVGLFCSAPQIRKGTSCMLLHLQQSKIESQLLKQVFVVLCKTMLGSSLCHQNTELFAFAASILYLQALYFSLRRKR